MFLHRGLFLAVVIPLASIALADVLTQQLPNQESTRYLSGVQTEYPYESYQANAPSHLVSYPHRPPYHNYHYLPRPYHPHYARIGGHGYVRPSVYVGYPQPLTGHNRSKRSRRSDPTSTESSKSEIPANDNDVATKSPLTDAKQPTTVDSLLPEHEPTDTNDKRVENRWIKYDYGTEPYLFGLYPENMQSGDSPLIFDSPSVRFAQSSQESESNDDNYSSKYRDASNNVKESAEGYETSHTSLLNGARYYMPRLSSTYARHLARQSSQTDNTEGACADPYPEVQKRPLPESLPARPRPELPGSYILFRNARQNSQDWGDWGSPTSPPLWPTGIRGYPDMFGRVYPDQTSNRPYKTPSSPVYYYYY